MFEAKSTENPTHFDLKNIVQHPLDYLKTAEKMGAICFFLIEFSKADLNHYKINIFEEDKNAFW